MHPDCTIIIPVPRADPNTDRITLRLHTHYLSAKSAFLRGLLSGISPVVLIRDLAASRPLPASPLRVPRSRLPRLLPSPPSHPVVFLPVPDPLSIQPLFHWMYSGNTDHIENALDQGLLQWDGLARNVEYLCLPTDIKVFLGRWYRTSFLPAHFVPDRIPCLADGDDQSDLDSDADDSDADDDCAHSGPSTDDELQSDDECDRGRTRDVKPLVQLCAQLRLCAT